MPKKEKQGVVVSNKMDKTAVVAVKEYSPHKKYKKIIETTKHYKVHDAENSVNEGDVVEILESKPISGSKRWTLKSIVEKAN